MSPSLNTSIAFALMTARWRQTIVAAIGVAFSITMFIALLSFMSGLNKMLDDLMLNRIPHIRLYNDNRPGEQPVNHAGVVSSHYNFIRSLRAAQGRDEIQNSQAILQHLHTDPRLAGFTAALSSQAFFHSGNTAIGAAVIGMDVNEENKLFHFNDYIISGNSADIAHPGYHIILGKGLADALFAAVGDMVQLTMPNGEIYQLKVVAINQTGIVEYDKTQSFVSIPMLQKMLGKPPGFTREIKIKLKDMTQAPSLSKEFSLKYECDAEAIQTVNAQFETGSFIRTLISYAVGITLLIVAGFGIYNILNMMIYEKMETIAILKATGFSGTDVRRIFLLIAVAIGLAGAVTGLLLGHLLAVAISHIPFNTDALPTIHTYPVDHAPAFYGIATLFSVVTTYLAGYFPARKASKTDPVTILRGK
jgi:lipoprotein-releasing system permease protein